MLFIVSIYQGEALTWFATVEAEDREGAIREAGYLLGRFEGTFLRVICGKRGPLWVDVDAKERTP